MVSSMPFIDRRSPLNWRASVPALLFCVKAFFMKERYSLSVPSMDFSHISSFSTSKPDTSIRATASHSKCSKEYWGNVKCDPAGYLILKTPKLCDNRTRIKTRRVASAARPDVDRYGKTRLILIMKNAHSSKRLFSTPMLDMKKTISKAPIAEPTRSKQ